MLYRYIWLVAILFSPSSFASEIPQPVKVDPNDLSFREALFYNLQGNHIDAISKLDIAWWHAYGSANPKSDPLHFRIGNVRYAVGNFAAAYRMNLRAESILKSIMNSTGDQQVRNEAAYYLAHSFWKRGEAEFARMSIERISGMMPVDLIEDELFLRTQIYMAIGNYPGAVRSLQKLQVSERYAGFAAYNLGVALIKIGQKRQGIEQLDKVAQMPGEEEVILALRERTNLALGLRMIENKQPELARQYLERIRLKGPFSNKALLATGWAEAESNNLDRAIVPWSKLSERDVSDKYVQESKLGVPFAYAQLGLHGKAALLYGKALEELDVELDRLNGSVKSVQDGRFLRAVQKLELKHDEHPIRQLGTLPAAPETSYLPDLMTSTDFQESFANYLDLIELSSQFDSWDKYLNSAEFSQVSVAAKDRRKYEAQVGQIRKSVRDSRSKVGGLIDMQGKMLEKIAAAELELRRKRILEYQAHARSGFVDSYENAIKILGSTSGEQ